ncbi:response regulator [bacterium]|nr:response regulator [bacterium]
MNARIKLKSLPIRTQLAVVYIAVTLALCLLVVLHLPTRITQQTMVSFRENTRSIAQVAAVSLSNPILQSDYNAVERFIQDIRQLENFSFIAIYDRQNSPLYFYPDSLNKVLISDQLLSIADYKMVDDRFIVRVPIERASFRIGTLCLGLSMSDLNVQTKNSRKIAVLYGLIILALGGAGFYGTSRLVAEPLTKLVRASEKVAESSSTLRIPSIDQTEMNRVAEAFNQTVDHLSNAHTQLEESHRSLEERVLVRTRRLSDQIHERIRTEIELKKSEVRFRSLIEESSDAMVVLKKGKIVYGNNKLAELSGQSLQAILAMNFDPLKYVHPKDKELITHRLERSRKGLKNPNRFNFRILTPQEKEIDFDAIVTTLDWDGEEATLVTLRDITEKRHLEERLLQSQKMEAIGRLAGGVAHDFNNLLTGIMGHATMAKMVSTSEKQLDAELEGVLNGAKRAADLTRQLLAFSRKQVIHQRVLRPNQILTSMTAMLKRLIRENITLVTNLTKDSGEIFADRGQFEQIILNLTVNASEAMPTGGEITISTSNIHLGRMTGEEILAAPPGDYVLLTVNDDGVGIPPAILPHVFEPFFTTKATGEGTGLGLATVFGAVKQSGGGISVKSEPQHGTTFFIYLPRSSESPTSELQVSEELPRGGEHILLVEDEESVCGMAVKMLSQLGYHVSYAENGSEGLELINNLAEPPDLVISDIIMPVMGGLEMIQKIKNDNPSQKVLFMSGYSHRIAEIQNNPEYSDRFLQKPFMPDQLARKVRQILDAVAV